MSSQDIATASSYGDLRENFEYQAAKDFQRQLLMRQDEMQRELKQVKGCDFSNAPCDKAGPGTTVVLRMADGSKRTYTILGEWDRDEHLNIISNKAPLAQNLKDKAVVVTSGTTSEILLHKLNDEKKMNMRIISAKDHGDSFRTLESGRAVAFMMDDALLAGERAKAKKPDNWEIVGTAQSKEAYGCMLRKDDPAFKALVDETVAQAQTSGEAAKWFDKWFKNPIPPKNLNLNFELSDDMKALFKSPNDKALN